jgi:hypothetical protein
MALLLEHCRTYDSVVVLACIELGMISKLLTVAMSEGSDYLILFLKFCEPVPPETVNQFIESHRLDRRFQRT